MQDDNPYQATTEKILDERDGKGKTRLEMLACFGVSAATQITGLFWGLEVYNPKVPSITNTVLEVVMTPIVMTQKSIAFLPCSYFVSSLIAMPIAWVWVGLGLWVSFLFAKWVLKHLRFYVALIWEEVAS